MPKTKTRRRIDVPQRQYAFASRDSERHILSTENVLVCTAWFGVDKKNGLAFMCHFDSPGSTQAVTEIVAELLSKVPKTHHFETYIVNGSRFLKPLRALFTRRRLLERIRDIEGFSHTLTPMPFARWSLRSLAILNARTGKWRRRDYSWQSNARAVAATTKRMTKTPDSE